SGEQISGPSAVVHCRGLPLTATEVDLRSLLSSYGRVENVCILRKGQALIEMDSIQSSTAIIDSTTPISLYGQKIQFSYSKSQHLNQPSKKSNAPMGAAPQQSAGNILLCSIMTPLYPITTNVLHTIMSPYGRVLKIVIFQKKGIQAFVEFELSYSAWAAKEALNGQDIYTGSCTLQIDFARVSTLNVRQNDDKTFDYTLDPYQTGMIPPQASPYGAFPQAAAASSYGKPMASPYGNVMAPPAAYPTQPQVHPGFMGYPMEQAGMPSSVIMVHKLPENVTSDHLFNLFCLYGTVVKVKMLHATKAGAMIQMADSVMADSAIHCLNQVLVFGQKLQVFHSRHQSIADSDKTKDYTDSPYNRFKAGGNTYKNIYKPSATLHFLNVPNTFSEQDLINVSLLVPSIECETT
ncbi:hypothetical protein SAMD00019534_059620, partial [Acytostelium subglobosum LB1]|uniref:hypothetical protein n=1 Tax=Acytostelium subglobosum LB1 TaxID=1410327 RepID=UPI000644D9F6